MTDSTLDLVRSLDPVAPADPAQAVTAGTREAMLTRIMQAEAPGGGDRGPAPARRRFLVRRVVPALVAAGLIGGVALSAVDLPGGTRQEAIGPALSFAAEGEFLRVRIVDPQADSARFNREFKKKGLDIELELHPSSPSGIGMHLAAGFGPDSPDIKVSLVPAGCDPNDTARCAPEFLVPKNYRGNAGLVIGRAPRPGEKVSFSGEIDGRNEPLQGVKYRNMRVAAVLAILAERGYTVPEYRVTSKNFATAPKTVPASFYVKGGFVTRDKQVILDVSPTR